MSVEAYIPYDLRERLTEQIKVIDKMMTDAVAAEHERCVKVMEDCRTEMRNRILRGSCDVYEVLGKALAAIRRGELESERAVGYREGYQAAVAAERERCIKVIENLMYENEWGNVLFDEIEAAIRKGV